MLTALLVLLAFVSALILDFVEAHYVRAVTCGHRHTAALCSIAMWGIGAASFVAVLEYSLYLMIPEGLGFYCGTMLAMRPKRPEACKGP